MSISSSTRKAGPFACNGSTVAFPFTFKVFTTADVRVVLTDSNSVESDLALGTNYTVALNADQDANPGGTVTTTATYATGYLVTLTSRVQNLQPVTLTNQGGFYPKVINTALDRLTILIQQAVEQVGRAVKTPISSGLSPDQLIADLYAVEANAGNSATAAANSAANSAASAAAAAAVLDNFDDRYLGQKTANPSLDNDGNTLQVGALYFNTVDGVMRVYTGTGWIDAATGVSSDDVSFLAAGGGAVATNVQVKLRESVSVKDFGAVGDGVTNDSAAILLAVSSGRRVKFPAGTYLIRSALVFSALSNFELVGDGAGVSAIKCHATDAFTNSALAFSGCNHFRVSGLTIDQNNNASFTATYPLVLALSCTDFSISENEVIHFTYIGVAANSCQRFWIDGNRVERDTAINTTNHAINVSSSVSTSGPAVVSRNLCKNSGSIYRGANITIANNRFDGNKYGAGICTSGNGTPTYGQYVVTGNICSGGTGVDADGFNVAGMEIDGFYCTINNNIVFQNAGPGIAMLAYRSTLQGNVCFGNGVGVGGAQYQAGIAMGYVSASQGAHYCHVSGNHCFDIGSGSQLYGYYEQSASLVGNTVASNKFDGNITGPVFFQGSAGYYETQDWVSYTPTITATSGTITTAGTCTGRYKRIGKTVFVKVSCAITTNGTGAGKVQITLPAIGSVNNGPYLGYGRESGLTGKSLIAQFLNGTQNLQAANYDDTYPGANGAVIVIEGFYEMA